LQEIKLRSGRVLKPNPPRINEEVIEEVEENNSDHNKTIKNIVNLQEKYQEPKPTPFRKRLLLEKQEKLQSLPETDILEELRNINIKIPLLQSIKEIPIYVKTIRDICNKNTARKKKDPQTIQVIGHLASLITTTPITQKYVD
jgi:tRNA A-37 threonylcarbamoyl transferase component Bud32